MHCVLNLPSHRNLGNDSLKFLWIQYMLKHGSVKQKKENKTWEHVFH